MKKLFALLCIVISYSSFAATQNVYTFVTVQQERQFHHLIKSLRCLVCQNQDLADSDAKLAHDLRAKVYDMVKAGRSDAEIKTYLTQRYGDFVLFKPPLNTTTALLWFGPFIFLALGFGFFLFRFYRAHRQGVVT